MIIYATKQTFERYKLKEPKELTSPLNEIVETIIEKESGDKIHEWGAKLFYFDRRKCIQVVNFASKMTLFLIDVKVDDLENVGDMIANYLFELYKEDKQMVKALEHMFELHPFTCLDKLKEKSIIATLNSTQRGFAEDGYRFYDFISDGILHSLKINYTVNFDWVVTRKVDGKKEYFYAGKEFRKIVVDRFGN